jgi:hypothetical protein
MANVAGANLRKLAEEASPLFSHFSLAAACRLIM